MVNLSTLKVVAFATWAYMATASPVRHPDNPEITLWGIKFTSTVIYSSPSHMAVATGTIDFTVENSLLSYTLSCQAYASRYPEIFYGEIPYECEAPADSLGGGTFTFSRPDGAITLNQTWVDEDIMYLAVGSGTIKPECASSTWRNPNWTVGELYSIANVVCAPVTVTLF